MITARSRTIGRDKLGELTGNDHEMIKFLEGTQADAANAIGGANDALAAATAAQAAADAAAANAALALSAAAAAQASALAALAAAAAAQADATSALANAATAQAAADAAQASANTGIANAATAQAAAGAAQASANTGIANAAAAQTTANSALTLATTINGDYVSKTAAAAQSVVSTFQAASYLVAGLQVVGPRVTGWTAATGTALLGAFNANTTYAAGVVYLQAEATAAYAGLVDARQRIKALEDAMRTHGLIN